MHRHALAGAALALGLLAGSPFALAETCASNRPAVTTLALSATGEARATPDMASFTVGVQTQAVDARTAQRASASKMTAVMAVLTRAGIAAPDLQTVGLTLSPQYVAVEDGPPRRTGYVASTSVHVQVRALPRLAQVIDAVGDAGADAVESVSFGLVDPAKMQDAARRDAVRRLSDAAAVYAQAAGLRVGRLVTLTADAVDSPVGPVAYAPTMMRAKTATPVAPGELTVHAQVSATYELQR